MTAENLAAISGVVLSLLFAYVPGFKEKYDQLNAPGKARVMAAALILVAGVGLGLACAKLAALFGLNLTCDVPGAVALIKVLIAALVANQATYLLFVRPFKKQ